MWYGFIPSRQLNSQCGHFAVWQVVAAATAAAVGESGFSQPSRSSRSCPPPITAHLQQSGHLRSSDLDSSVTPCPSSSWLVLYLFIYSLNLKSHPPASSLDWYWKILHHLIHFFLLVSVSSLNKGQRRLDIWQQNGLPSTEGPLLLPTIQLKHLVTDRLKSISIHILSSTTPQTIPILHPNQSGTTGNSGMASPNTWGHL